MTKTNAMRLLDKAKILYSVHEYEYDENDLSGVHAAEFLKISPSEFFKTLVLKGSKNGYFVCCIPVDKELDLKLAAAVMKDKSAEMLHVKDLLGITGYIRGGCSPIGMKKKYPTFIDESCTKLSEIYVSAGVRGCSVKLKVDDLVKYVDAAVCGIIKQ